MNTVTAYLDLDFCESESMRAVHVKQGDSGGLRQIRLSLYSNRQRVTFAETDTAQLYASINSIATVTGDECTIMANDDIIVPITEDMTKIAGVEHCELRITTASGKRIHTARFDLIVGAAVINGDTPGYLPSTSVLDQIAQLREDLDALTEQVNDIGDSINEINDNISTIQSDVETLSVRVDTIEDNLAALTSRVAWLEYAVAYLTNIPWALPATVDPEYDHRIITAAAKSLPKQGGYQYYDLTESGFDYTVDGLVLYHDGGYGYILPDRYTLSEISGGVRILFNGTEGSVSVQGELTCHLFIKPREESNE